MNEKIKIREMIQIFKRRFLFLIFTTVCTAGFIVFSSMYLIKPTYEYSLQVIVGFLGTGEADEPVNKVDENRQLAISFMDVIDSPHIMLEVIEALNLKQTSYELLEQVSVMKRDNSQVITITTKNTDPQLTKDIALSIANQSTHHFKAYANIDQIHILHNSATKQNVNLLFPKPTLMIIISILVGIFTGLD